MNELILRLRGHDQDNIDKAVTVPPVQIKKETKPKAETKDKTATKADSGGTSTETNKGGDKG